MGNEVGPLRVPDRRALGRDGGGDAGRRGGGCDRGAAGHSGRQKRRHAAFDAQSCVAGGAGRGSGGELHAFAPVRGFRLHIPSGDDAFRSRAPAHRVACRIRSTHRHACRTRRPRRGCVRKITAAGSTARPHRPRDLPHHRPGRSDGLHLPKWGAHVCAAFIAHCAVGRRLSRSATNAPRSTRRPGRSLTDGVTTCNERKRNAGSAAPSAARRHAHAAGLALNQPGGHSGSRGRGRGRVRGRSRVRGRRRGDDPAEHHQRALTVGIELGREPLRVSGDHGAEDPVVGSQ
jgi:hypothetical protein